MTNNEYEKMSVDAATGRMALAYVDDYIDSLEKSLEHARERRRELINRYNLNKCGHRYLTDSDRCPDCGELVQ